MVEMVRYKTASSVTALKGFNVFGVSGQQEKQVDIPQCQADESVRDEESVVK